MRDRFLGGASFMPLFAPEGGAGSGGGDGGGSAGGGTRTDSGGAASVDAGGAQNGGSAGQGSPGAGGGAGGTTVDSGGASATLAGGGAAADAAAAAAAAAVRPAFGEKWREDLAGDDKDAAKDLAKYTDPKAVYKSLRDLQTKISKGELKTAPAGFPAQGTDEQKAAWRAAQGLPGTKEDYVKNIALPNGVVLGEADKPFLDSFAQKIFEDGGTQSELSRAVNWFYQAQDAAEQSRNDGDGQFRVDSMVALRQEWGNDYNGNMAAFGAFKAQMPADLQAMIFTARTADGQILGNHPAFLKIGAALGREINPAASIMPADPLNAGKSMESELAHLESLMGDPRSEYNRGPKANQMQARYRELTDAMIKIQARGRAA